MKASRQGYDAEIAGSRGSVIIRDLVYCEDRPDLLEIYYVSAVAVLDGHYHCCMSVPGKVSWANY